MSRSCSAALVAMFALFCGCHRATSGPAEDAGPALDAATLAATDFLPVRGEAIRENRNYVYSSTFQMAWDELKERLGGPLRFQKPSSLAEYLNRESFNLNDISPDAYFIFSAEWKPEIGRTIQAQRDRKFRHSTLAVPDIPGRPGEYVVYAYLLKQLDFHHLFERHTRALSFQSSNQVARVASFGAPGDDSLTAHHAGMLSAQVKVLSYASANDFVIVLEPKQGEDEIVLAKLKPGRTMEETIALVQDRATKHPASPEGHTWNPNEEPLFVPLIRLRVRGRFPELEDKEFKAPHLAGTIAWTFQELSFRLDERGARVESQAGATYKSALMPSSPEKRRFLFDRPFLVLLRRREAKAPYLALWIGNAELLQPFQ